MMLATVRSWARSGYQPPRDISLVFFADEEAGGSYGSRWMVENRPDVFAGCNEAISEVGGFSITLENKARLYLIETAQKGIHWMRLVAEGRAGHGSMVHPDNAVTAVAEAVARIGNYEWPLRRTKSVDELLERVAEVLGVEYDPNDPEKRKVYKDAMWVGMPLLAQNATLLANDVKIEVRVTKPYREEMSPGWFATEPVNNNLPMYTFSTADFATVRGDLAAAETALDLIRAVPNPYYASSDYERTQLDNIVKITRS